MMIMGKIFVGGPTKPAADLRRKLYGSRQRAGGGFVRVPWCCCILLRQEIQTGA